MNDQGAFLIIDVVVETSLCDIVIFIVIFTFTITYRFVLKSDRFNFFLKAGYEGKEADRDHQNRFCNNYSTIHSVFLLQVENFSKGRI